MSCPLKVAIIGAGPAGLFAAEALLKQGAGLDLEIDIFERLPAPFGLVRYGVAPDHYKIKSVTQSLGRVFEQAGVRLFAGAEYGSAFSYQDLKARYQARIFTTGASLDRAIGIPGEELDGNLSSTALVGWYNGHPDYRHLSPRLSPAVAVIGAGNVAIDVVRILAKTAAELSPTDISRSALSALAQSPVENLYLIGRRGPAQARFTPKELRELGELQEADVHVDPADLELDPVSQAEADRSPQVQRNLEILRSFAAQRPSGKRRRIHLLFRWAPLRVLGSTSAERLELGRTHLGPAQEAILGEQRRELAVGTVVRAVGYRSQPVPGLPFDPSKQVVANRAGRVEGRSGDYVAGWIKRGPSGVIGTNKADAAETVASLLADLEQLEQPQGALPIEVALEERGIQSLDLSCWKRLDSYELQLGSQLGCARVKISDPAEMLRISRAGAAVLSAEV